MPALEPLYCLIGTLSQKLSKNELTILEAELFIRLCEKLKEIFRQQYQEYFRLMRFTKEMENNMLETNFVRLIIDDILSTKEYTIEGIARYIDMPKEVIHDILNGRNTNPSALLLRRTIELHRSVKYDLYCEIVKKITAISTL